jgi:eukaryotic-like serine/threonine-protein kinase
VKEAGWLSRSPHKSNSTMLTAECGRLARRATPSHAIAAEGEARYRSRDRCRHEAAILTMHRPADNVLDSSAPSDRPGDQASLLLEACEQLEQSLRRGDAVRAEDFLGQRPEFSADPESALDLIYVEYATRRELGATPLPAEYLKRFPQWRDLLQRVFQLEELLDSPTPPRDDVASAVAAPTPAVPASGRFRTCGLLARGGIGQVLRAIDTELHREVAVKELQPALADDDEVRQRFLREAEITGKLEHPGIVPVYGLQRDAAGRPFYAMRLVRGQALQEAVVEFHERHSGRRRFVGLEFQKLLRRFLHVCQTIAYAHSRGVVHRDLKPENILLGPFGETLVVDWGLAKVMAADDLQAGLPSAGEAPPAWPQPCAAIETKREVQDDGSPAITLNHLSSQLTQDAGQWIGTPAYMSPEQALGQAHRVGPAGDVYSLGATLYVLLAGQAPLTGDSVQHTLRRVIDGDFLRPRALCRAIPPPLEAICLKAMARRPEERYASPSDLADDIERWLADEPVTAARESIFARVARWGRRNRSRVVAATIALIVVTMVSLAAAVLINGERLRADRQRLEADRRTARLAFDRGYALAKDHEYGAGLLWYSRALAHAPQDDLPLRRVILTNMDAARHHLLRRRGTFVHSANLTAVAISADGKRLATADYDNGAQLWDIDSGELLANRQLRKRAQGAHISSDGTAVFATVRRKTLTLEKLSAAAAAEPGSPVTINSPQDLSCPVFSADGSLLATGCRSSGATQARLWRVSNGELVAEFPHPRSVVHVAFRPHHEELATVGGDGQLRLWKTDGRTPLWELKLATGQVEQFAFDPSGRRIVVGDSEGSLSCFDVDARRRLFELAREPGRVTAIACATDSPSVAAAWSNGIARTWNLDDRRQLWELLRIDRHTEILSFRPQTRQMLIASEPHSAVLWDIPDSSNLGIPLSQGDVSAIGFSPDAKTAITGSRNGTVVLRDAESGTLLRSASSHQGSVQVVAFRTDGAVVLTASHDGTARLSKAASGQPHGQLMDHRAGGDGIQVEAAAFSPDGRIVVTGDNRGVVRIWNGDTGELVRELARHNGSVRSLCFGPGGDRVVAGFGAPDSGVRLWDVSAGKELWSAAHGNTVRSVTFSPDGKFVLSASNDVTARFWSAADGQQVGSAMPHRGEVFIGAFSPDGSLAATGGYDATVRLWAVPTGRPVGEPMQHEGVITAAEFSADGKILFTGGSLDRSARLWDVPTCLPLSPPLVHRWSVMAVGLHPSGRIAYTGRVWRLPSPLPDEPALIDQWVKLATQRNFTAGDNVEWLRPADIATAASEFQASAGRSWDEWAD